MMDSREKPNGIVRWGRLATYTVIFASLMLALGGGALAMHGKSPHEGAVSRAVLNANIDSINKRLDDMHADLKMIQGILIQRDGGTRP